MSNLDIDDLERRGRYDLDTWLLLVACPLAGAAIGLAQDRAEARAKSEWSERFLRLIETDHCISVEITHKHAAPASRTEH